MGPLLILVSASCFGAMAIFGKLAYAAGIFASQRGRGQGAGESSSTSPSASAVAAPTTAP